MLGKTVLPLRGQVGTHRFAVRLSPPTDVADEIWRTRKIRIDRRKVDIDPIKRIGRYAIPITLFEDVQVEVKTLVVPEGGEASSRGGAQLSKPPRPRPPLPRRLSTLRRNPRSPR